VTSVRAALAGATDRLASAGCDTPRLDAELLLGEALGAGRSELLVSSGRRLDDASAARFEALLRRREGREPVAYILERKAFRHLELSVDHRVLVPRPETELLVEAGLDRPYGARVVDVGTGSGAVALALKQERPDLCVTATDASPDALSVARANARRLGLDVAFHRADLLAGVPGGFDTVLANLPYVADADLTRLSPEVADYEPRLALSGGSDGLDAIRRLVAQSGPVAFLGLEVGAGQAGAVARLLAATGFTAVDTSPDLAGIERVVVGRRG
jgi:release factor glutamine methyltransferase